jgi:copper chaperone
MGIWFFNGGKLKPGRRVSMEKITLKVEGMSCGHCKAAVEKALKETSGVRDAEVNLTSKSVDVTYDQDRIDRAGLVNAIENAGYDVQN